MKQILFYLGLLPLLSFNAQALKLYLLSNHDNAGDHHQVLGILTAFEKLSNKNLSFKDLNTKVTRPSKIKEVIESDHSAEKIIVIGAGEGGIDGIMDLSINSNLIICLTSHMFLERYKDPTLLEKVTYISLPTHASIGVKKQLGAKLIETTGVAHNRQPEEVDKVYETWKNTELPACDTYLGVILGGDAPLPGPGKAIQLFTEKEVTKLAEYVVQNAKEACVLVLNGPRTGKYDLNQNEILTVHRKGYSDSITELFKRQLEVKGLKNMKVFDFQHDTPENEAWVLPYNAFDLVVGALRSTKGSLIVPGDSTSVISEAIDTLSPGKVLVYEDSAMNDVHKAHLASELAAGRISVLEDYRTIKTSLQDFGERPSRSHQLEAAQPKAAQLKAAMVIAQKLWEESSSREQQKK